MMFRKINSKILTTMLSVIVLSMVSLSIVSFINSKQIIESQISKNMESELETQVNNIQLRIQKITTMASLIARNVESTYKTTQLGQYEKMLGKIIYDSDLAMGSGIWFEPYVYDKMQKYTGPYIYKDGDKAVTTYEYSNETYDYISYDWYNNYELNSKEPSFSPLYYDQTLDVTMSTCTAPMYDEDNTFIGVITVDIEITLIQDLINQLKLGNGGEAQLLTKDGLYITNESADKILSENIKDSTNKSYASLGNEIITKEYGKGNYADDISNKYEVYYSTVDKLGWHILLKIPTSEVNRPLTELSYQLAIISLIVILVSICVIMPQISYITKNIKRVNNFAINLAKGDLTTDKLPLKSKDELGQLSNSLNNMLDENKDIIKAIAGDSTLIKDASSELNKTSNNLITSFNMIKSSINGINEAMVNTSATTEEINASVEEVNALINVLTQETEKSYNMAAEIKLRAGEVEKKSESSYSKATGLAVENENNIAQSMEDSKVVESIGDMAEAISQIADQVNLLSLNASIEAARAGEQGRGFAVVAKEIGSLASQTAKTVDEIKITIHKVNEAFNNLMNNSKNLLSFIKETVSPDYKDFLGMANQYNQDAMNIESSVINIATMTKNIDKIIYEVSTAIQDISAASQNTAVNSGDIIYNIDMVSEVVNDLSLLTKNEQEISEKLDIMVKKFKIG